MATTTPNFGWSVPTSSDLVKNGATAIETLGDAIDASLVDLKGGTTGQVLSKASGTDMDFTWTAAATVSNQFFAGKNKIINGNFGIWQRGTSGFSLGAAYNADRWLFYRDGSGATDAVTQQSFTVGAAPVAGYESQYFWRYAATVAGTGGTERSLYQRIEDVRTFAGQTVTVSFWAKADAARTITLSLVQNFGSGGSASVTTSLTSQSATTSWARYSATVAVPSISSKTVGTSSYLQLTLGFPVNVTETIDIWGVQVEAGSTATDFQTATGTIQGELAACQRYYQRATGTATNTAYSCSGVAISTTRVFLNYASPVTLRTAPSVAQSSASIGNGVISNQNITSIAYYSSAGLQQIILDISVGSGLTASGFFVLALPQNAYIELSAEL